MRRPNFFILGAPKCGTTSMADWLGGHPKVFMSTPKEPTYFCDDLIPWRPRDPEEYETLFEVAHARHDVVGEASTSYLYSRTAVPNILDYAEHPRFLVMVRNPIDMAHSLHGEHLFQGNEQEPAFERAWELQEVRASDPDHPSISRACNDPQLLMYGPFSRTGEQLARLYEWVPRASVHVALLDDVKEDPRREYRKVLEFLGLPDDDRREFPVRNVAKSRRSPRLARLMRLAGKIRLRLGPTYRGLGLATRLSNLNRRTERREPLSDAMRHRLAEYFRDDVERLGELLDRDLSHWVELE